MSNNKLDLGGDNPQVSHSTLASAYEINGERYGLLAVVQGARDYAGISDNGAWDRMTLTKRLEAVNKYLEAVKAVQVTESPNGSDTERTDDTGTAGADASGGDANELDDLKNSNARMADVLSAARAELGFGETGPDTDLFEPSIVEGIQGVKQQIADVRARLGVGEADSIKDAIDALYEKASGAEQRATVAEKDASKVRTEFEAYRKNADTLHGSIESLKPPY